MRNLAPIALFVYNRPDHTKRTLDALAANAEARESALYIFCDGAKAAASEEQLKNIQEVKVMIRTENRFKQVLVMEQEQNVGLAGSVIAGVTQVLSAHDRIIVLEDDLVTSPHFLSFMNDALNTYAQKEEVACVSGYIYPVEQTLPETFFIKGADCWGWATWKRAWAGMETDGAKLLAELENKKLTEEFDFGGTYPYTQMLRDQIAGKNSSWAIRWYASAFLKNKLCLYPGISLIQNIGIDGSGTHSGISDKWDVKLAKQKVQVSEISCLEDCTSKQVIAEYFKSIKRKTPSMAGRLIGKVKQLFNPKK